MWCTIYTYGMPTYAHTNNQTNIQKSTHTSIRSYGSLVCLRIWIVAVYTNTPHVSTHIPVYYDTTSTYAPVRTHVCSIGVYRSRSCGFNNENKLYMRIGVGNTIYCPKYVHIVTCFRWHHAYAKCIQPSHTYSVSSMIIYMYQYAHTWVAGIYYIQPRIMYHRVMVIPSATVFIAHNTPLLYVYPTTLFHIRTYIYTYISTYGYTFAYMLYLFSDTCVCVCFIQYYAHVRSTIAMMHIIYVYYTYECCIPLYYLHIVYMYQMWKYLQLVHALSSS